MALVKCRECGKKISNTAPTCPNCGARGFGPQDGAAPAQVIVQQVPAKPQTSIVTWMVALFIGLPILVSCYISSTRGPSSPPRTAPATPTIEDHARTAIEVAKREVAAQMKDPASATFREFYVVKTPAGGLLVCGEVNSKNSFGAMSGFSRFMWNTSVVVHEESTPHEKFVDAWNGSCAKWPTVLSKA